MSKPLSKTDLVRTQWLVELRRQGHRQCAGSTGKGEQVCALVLLAQTLYPYERWCDISRRLQEEVLFYENTWFVIGKQAGLNERQVDDVIERNDGKCAYKRLDGDRDLPGQSFAQIADVIEGWFRDGAQP